MKTVLFVLDGIADEPIESLENKTPLEIAKTPHLKALALTGSVQRLRLLDPRTTPTESTSCMALLGYEPTPAHTARGPIHASAIRLRSGADEWLLACRLVTVSDGKLLDPGAGNISDREAAALYEMLNRAFRDRGLRFFTDDGRCHVLTLPADRVDAKFGELDVRGPLELRGRELWGAWSKTPAGIQLKKWLAEAAELLEIHEVNKVRIDLNENPANALWAWGIGKPLLLKPFSARGKSIVFSSSEVWRGAAQAAEIAWAPAFAVPQGEAADLADISSRAWESLRQHDLVIVHLNDADRASLDGDFRKKVRWIEAFDQHLIGNFRERLSESSTTRVAVVSGHVTSSTRRERTSAEAPCLIWGPGVESATQAEFTEEASARTGKVYGSGADFLKQII